VRGAPSFSVSQLASRQLPVPTINHCKLRPPFSPGQEVWIAPLAFGLGSRCCICRRCCPGLNFATATTFFWYWPGSRFQPWASNRCKTLVIAAKPLPLMALVEREPPRYGLLQGIGAGNCVRVRSWPGRLENLPFRASTNPARACFANRMAPLRVLGFVLSICCLAGAPFCLRFVLHPWLVESRPGPPSKRVFAYSTCMEKTNGGWRRSTGSDATFTRHSVGDGGPQFSFHPVATSALGPIKCLALRAPAPLQSFPSNVSPPSTLHLPPTAIPSKKKALLAPIVPASVSL